jgi:hypothetical protein
VIAWPRVSRRTALVVIGALLCVTLKVTTDRPAKQSQRTSFRPAKRTEAQLPIQFWTNESRSAFEAYWGQRNLSLRNPDDNVTETIDESGQVWRNRSGERLPLGTHTIEKVELTKDKIDEWIIRIELFGQPYFLVLQTVDTGLDFTVVMGQGDIVIDGKEATMLGRRFYIRTDRDGLLYFVPINPDMTCPSLQDC